MDSAQKNYATTEKEFLAVVFACDKFRQYSVDSKVTIHTGNSIMLPSSPAPVFLHENKKIVKLHEKI